MMKLFLIYCNNIICFIKRGWLYLLRKDPIIQYFICDPIVGINDLPQFIKWKVKYCWKVEIEDIGWVTKHDCQILKNRKLRPSLTLKAYGRKNKSVSQVLDLNLRKAILPHIPSLHKIDFQSVETLPGERLYGLLKQIHISHAAFNFSFYTCQENKEVQEALQIITPPPRINAHTENITTIIEKSAILLLEYYSLHYNNELNQLLQTKT